MRKVLIGLLFGLGVASACGGGPSKADVAACVERGVAYFKEIGSYPTLTAPMYKGRKAEDVARERCNRTITAF